METALTTNPRMPVDSVSADSTAKSDQARSEGPASAVEAVAPGTKRSAWSRWLNRVALSLFVLFCAVLGVWLTLLPWSLQWTDNPLLWTHPDLRTFLGYGFVRGVCSGLGILDLWIGIRQASHYTERLGNPK